MHMNMNYAQQHCPLRKIQCLQDVQQSLTSETMCGTFVISKFSKQNKSDLKFDDEFLSHTSHVQVYNLKTNAKFQNPTHGFAEELS